MCYNINVNKGCDLTQSAKRRKEKIMTNREFLTAIINGSLTDEVVDFAKSKRDALDNGNA